MSDSLRESLLGSTFVLSGLRYTDEQIEGLYMSLDTILQESSTYQSLVRRGKCDLLLTLGGERFGPPNAATESTLRAIKDSERLDRLAKRIFNATSWDDLLATE